ncbi:unnamed protein product [Closterium sp. NIES-54]
MNGNDELTELEQRVKERETVVQGGTGGKSLEAQIHLAEGRCNVRQHYFESLVGRRAKGGRSRVEDLGRDGYHEMGRIRSGGKEAAKEQGIEIDESKYRT